MRTLFLIPILALAACSGENSGWNPNYQAKATGYGDYLRQRELALTGTRAEPPRVIPVALPVKAPTPEQIAGPSPVRILEQATTPRRAQAAPAQVQPAPVHNRAPAVDPRLTPPPAVLTPTPLRRSRTISTSPGRAVAPLSQTPLLDAYASSSRHTPGTVVWPRANPRPTGLACSGYASAASAQTAFLNSGGPGTDRLGLDPDGDGYACGWNPAPYQNPR